MSGRDFPCGHADLAHHFGAEERAWQEAGPELAPAVRRLAAAHAAAAFPSLLPAAAALERGAPPWLAGLMAASRRAAPEGGPEDREAWAAFQAVRPLAAPAAALLLADADARLDRDRETGRNRYGAGPLPDPRLVAFSSSTANPPTEAGLRAADAALAGLRRDAVRQGLGPALERAGAGLKARLSRLLALEDGTEMVLAASGTAAALIATHLAAPAPNPAAAPTLVLVVGAEESGSAVPLAAGARHPAARTPGGVAVEEGGAVSDLAGRLAVEGLAIRAADGRPRPPEELLGRLKARIEGALEEGRAVVLHAMDGSKTGLVAPGADGIGALVHAFPEAWEAGRLKVIVDACQMRVPPGDLARLLARGALVTVTGSKFLGGPAFSGLVLLPPGFPAPSALARGLAAYSAAPAWPAAWTGARAGLAGTGGVGCLLRWEAALAEAALFLELPAAAQAAAGRRFWESARGLLARFPAVRQLFPMQTTIATFAVRGREGDGWQGMEGLRRLYRRLREADCLSGQPVALAAPPITGALRVAASAAHLARLADGRGHEVAAELEHLLATLERLRLAD